MRYNISDKCNKQFHIHPFLHSVFFEYFGRVIYDGIWVGKDSDIPNIDGIRLDIIEGCRELGVGAMRWPGGCCADHYHWKNGIGPVRKNRIHPLADKYNPEWRHDFGTDEFLKFCELTGAEPILTVNTATGTPEEFLDWYEYVNGSQNTMYGQLRAENGHAEPYYVKYWGLGNTDENVWACTFNDPEEYGRIYRRFRTVLRWVKDDLYFIGLGLSTRHKLPGWVGRMLDYVTGQQRESGPNALSIHHYLGGAKQGGELCGTSLDYTDEGYYALLNLLERYQYDIDLHRALIKEHTNPNYPTDICFDEWGAWHADASNIIEGQNQTQTLRDAIFAALTLHIFYRNSDVVKFAMETQLSNLLQSLFETDGERMYKTPTFYIMKLFREHIDQYLLTVLPTQKDEMLDLLATISKDGQKTTVSIVNKHLYEEKTVQLQMPEETWSVIDSAIVCCDDVRAWNDFDNPERICIHSFEKSLDIKVPPHSVVRMVLELG